jgi:serine/threonine-protein kinase
VQTAATDTLVGRSLEGRYRILERIARGGMSTVYAAVDERLDRLVAVKVMSSALSADPAFSDRFAREARAAARLTHLNVVSVYDQGSEQAADGLHVFLVMELVEGRTLRELLRERGRLSPAEAISIMEPVLSALAAAHRAGLVHRDVKPENILLSDDGIVKVADFGLARAVEADAAATRTGLMMGTVAYCAPEQISQGRVDQRSDVYAAGVVLFELLTGTPPYKGESAMNVAYQHVHSRVPAPSSRVKGVPDEIDELVVAATDSDPSGRPADAGAFLAEVADVRAELGLPVVPVPPRDRTRTRAGRAGQQYGTPDVATTDHLGRRASRNDTTIVPRRAEPPRIGDRLPLFVTDNGAPQPPPPIVTPPRKGSPRSRRRRRTILGIILMLLLGLAAGTAGWWFASGRYGHVPDVIGSSKAAAVAKLHNAGFDAQVQQVTEFSATIPRGDVVRTDPTPGGRLVKGHPVKIYLSAGPHFYSVLPVRGKSPEQARATLLSVGPLTVAADVKQEPSDTVPAGEVTRTDPAAGRKVTSEQPVTIYVSTGPPIVAVPSIDQCTPLHAAKHTLTSSPGKFKVTTVREFSDTCDAGTVISLNPNDKARKFSTISVTVSKGPHLVTIPTFPPLAKLAGVQSTLEGLGLHVNVETAFGGYANRVVGMDPPAGTSVHYGSTVTLTVV